MPAYIVEMSLYERNEKLTKQEKANARSQKQQAKNQINHMHDSDVVLIDFIIVRCTPTDLW